MLRGPYREPIVWIVEPVAITGCLFLLLCLPQSTQILFLSWNLLICMLRKVRSWF